MIESGRCEGHKRVSERVTARESNAAPVPGMDAPRPLILRPAVLAATSNVGRSRRLANTRRQIRRQIRLRCVSRGICHH
jgi:hypothetical protein